MARPRTPASPRSDAVLLARAKAILERADMAALGPVILPLVEPSIELVPGLSVVRPKSVGRTRIGGEPDLPPRLPWPSNRRGQPLSFLLQIALGELPGRGPLPSRGLLAFFLDTLDLPDGAEALAAGSCRVVYLDARRTTRLARRPAPANAEGPLTDTFEERRLAPKVVPSFPDDVARIPAAARGKYLSALVNPDRPVFKLLGHPNTIQTSMQQACAMIARRLDPQAKVPPALVARLAQEAEDWLLLLQVDSSDELSLQWGDSGRLYLWIHSADLASRSFDRTLVLLQSH